LETLEVDMVFDKIKNIIVEQLQVEPEAVALETSLMKDLEADSLDAVEIIMGIENEFDIEIPDEEAEKFKSVSDIVAYVEANAK
jgi:acyl carrier protein